MEVNKMIGKRIVGILFVAILALVTVAIVRADPITPTTIDPLGSSRYVLSPAANYTAIAGNVTEINFDAESITETWQGYFGNITGRIVLGNADNQAMYDWNLASPQGEIFATRDASVPTWGAVRCANTSEMNVEETTNLGASSTAPDGIDETFASTTHPEFLVGSQTIGQNNCSTTNLYNDTGAQAAQFYEVLLSDGMSSDLIYTALLESDKIGFDGRSHDFEMLVGENGHGNSDVSTYYFYVELE